MPVADPRLERDHHRITLQGDVPSPVNSPSGCRFRTRCWKAEDLCAVQAPNLEMGPNDCLVACHFPES